jgi:hypothetical protein
MQSYLKAASALIIVIAVPTPAAAGVYTLNITPSAAQESLTRVSLTAGWY